MDEEWGWTYTTVWPLEYGREACARKRGMFVPIIIFGRRSSNLRGSPLLMNHPLSFLLGYSWAAKLFPFAKHPFIALQIPPYPSLNQLSHVERGEVRQLVRKGCVTGRTIVSEPFTLTSSCTAMTLGA